MEGYSIDNKIEGVEIPLCWCGNHGVAIRDMLRGLVMIVCPNCESKTKSRSPLDSYRVWAEMGANEFYRQNEALIMMGVRELRKQKHPASI